MSSLFRSIQRHAFIRGIIYLILGVLIVLKPHQLFSFAVYLISAYNVALGLINLFGSIKNNQSGQMPLTIFYFIFALIIWLFAKPIASILPIFLGIIIIASGASQISRALNLRQYVNVSYMPMLIYGIILLIAGVLILFNPFSSLIIVFQFFGIVLIFSGISEIVTGIRLKNYKNPDVF